MEYTPEQKAAITTKDNKVVILSSAACGKTAIITERVRYLLDKGVEPSKIVLITFTVAAADEMRSRIGEKGKDCFIGTIHSYANKLLTKKGISTGRLIQDGKFDQFFKLISENLYCIEPVEHLLLDEAQDSDASQFEFILEHIKPDNYFFVGDPRQSIYTFRDARPDMLISLSRQGDVSTYRVRKNYRNASRILAFAKEKLGDASLPDDSIAMSDKFGHVFKTPFTKETLVGIIKNMKNSKYSDWFVLGRTNAIVDTCYDYLIEAGIPCTTFKQGGMTAQDLKEKMEEDTVKVLTIHSAKGLEAKNVVVFGAIYSTDENKRLNYVAATHAKENLFWGYTPPKKKKKMMNWER